MMWSEYSWQVSNDGQRWHGARDTCWFYEGGEQTQGGRGEVARPGKREKGEEIVQHPSKDSCDILRGKLSSLIGLRKKNTTPF